MTEPVKPGTPDDENISDKSGEQIPPKAEGDKKAEAKVEPPVTVTPKKIELTEEELNDRIAAALTKEREATEAEAKRKAAIESGNTKQLLDDAEAELKKTRLQLWRSHALAKHGLSDQWFDALNGENEKDIDNAAKALKKRIDDEVAAKAKNQKDAETVTPPGGKGVPPTPAKIDGEAVVKRNIASAFNIGGMARRNYS